MQFITSRLVALGVEVDDAEEAIRIAGNLLCRTGFVESCYVDAMVESYGKNGPYFVIAPHIAVPHARPQDGSNSPAISLVTLRSPVPFGSEANDPVNVVFGLAACSDSGHLELLQKLVGFLRSPATRDAIAEAASYSDIERLLEGNG